MNHKEEIIFITENIDSKKVTFFPKEKSRNFVSKLHLKSELMNVEQCPLKLLLLLLVNVIL